MTARSTRRAIDGRIGTGRRPSAAAAIAVAPQVRNSLADVSHPAASRRYALTSSERTVCRRPSSSSYWNSSWPGSSWQLRTARTSRRSCSSTSWRDPDLPRNTRRTPRPSARTCRVRKVVNPNESLARAYSSLPTRINVRSRRAVTVASTLARRTVGAGKVGVHAPADGRQRLTELDQPVELHTVTKLPPGRVVPVLLAALGVAAGGLQVPAIVRTDPDVGPRGRDGQPADPLERRGIVDRAPARRRTRRPIWCPIRRPTRLEVDEALAAASPPDPRVEVARVHERVAGLRRAGHVPTPTLTRDSRHRPSEAVRFTIHGNCVVLTTSGPGMQSSDPAVPSVFQGVRFQGVRCAVSLSFAGRSGPVGIRSARRRRREEAP